MFKLHRIQQLLIIGLTLIFSVDPNQALSMTIMKKGQCLYVNQAKGYDCMKLDLTVIPTDLSSSTEVLDASLNRIRELKNNSFKNYAYLKKLYLNDNMIQTIESGTFDNLCYLHTLDLSVNSLVDVPVSLLHILTLRSLNLAKNTLLNVTNLFNKAAPITAPLQQLDVSFTLVTQWPNFEGMIDLIHLNMTGNHVTNVSKANFTHLCNLKLFTNPNLTMEFNSVCDCIQIYKWFEIIQVVSEPEFLPRCEFANDKCTDDDVKPTAKDLAIHEKCISEYQSREATKSILKFTTIILGSIGGILLILIVCYFYYKWQSFSDTDDNKFIKDQLKSEKVNTHLLIKQNEYNNS